MIFHFVQRRPLEAAGFESEDDAMFGDRWWYLDGLLTLLSLSLCCIWDLVAPHEHEILIIWRVCFVQNLLLTLTCLKVVCTNENKKLVCPIFLMFVFVHLYVLLNINILFLLEVNVESFWKCAKYLYCVLFTKLNRLCDELVFWKSCNTVVDFGFVLSIFGLCISGRLGGKSFFSDILLRICR